MTFLLKPRYVKSSFKIGARSASPCSMFPSHGTKQSATSRTYPQANLHLFSGSRVPQARCSSKSHQPAAYGKEDKGGHKAQEQPAACAQKQTPQLHVCSSAGPLLYDPELQGGSKPQEPCNVSRFREKEVDDNVQRSEDVKIQIWVSCSTGEHKNRSLENNILCFLEAETRITPRILSFHGSAVKKNTSSPFIWLAL